MALIKCPECGKEISDRSQICIQCGFPISEYVREQKNNIETSKQKQSTNAIEEKSSAQEKNIENKEDSCPKCGNPLDKSLRVCMKCGYRERDEKDKSFVLCPECGGQNRINDDVCIHCHFNFKTGTYEKPKLYTAQKQNNTQPTYTDYSSSVVKNSKPKKKKGACGTIIWVLIIISMISSCFDNEDKKENSTQNKSTFSVEATRTPTPEPVESSAQTETEEKYSFNDELSIFEKGEYKFITPKDLNKYHSNLVGMKFYTITTINEFKENYIQCTLDGGVMMSGFDTVIDYTSILHEDDRIAVLGEIGDYNDYGFMGKSLYFNNCYVFAVNADCDKYNYIKSDDYFAPYFIVTEEVAKSSNDISETEFKALCNPLSYADILRNPDSYKDKHCIVSGRVNQVIEGILSTYSIYIEDSHGDIWACMYMYKDGESHLLENDNVTVYGICDGTTTSTTVLGKQVTMPYIDIEYIN